MRLIERLLGAEFLLLDAEVQALHRQRGIHEGEITVRTSILAQVFGFPPPCKDAPLWFATREEDGVETWMRQIKDRELRSELWNASGRLAERMGGVMLTTEPQVENGALRLTPRAVRFWDIPLPRFLWPQVTTREWGEDGRYRFSIEIKAPITGGVILAYDGWLSPA